MQQLVVSYINGLSDVHGKYGFERGEMQTSLSPTTALYALPWLPRDDSDARGSTPIALPAHTRPFRHHPNIRVAEAFS